MDIRSRNTRKTGPVLSALPNELASSFSYRLSRTTGSRALYAFLVRVASAVSPSGLGCGPVWSKLSSGMQVELTVPAWVA
jgi:hypothetical protein